MLMLVMHEFPSSGWMFASPPFAEAGFGISRVLGSAAPHDTPRIAAVVDQLALPNRVAPRPDRCVLVWNLCARRGTGCLCQYGAICGRARTGWRVLTRQHGVTGGVRVRVDFRNPAAFYPLLTTVAAAGWSP
jgi:hypothetical protein